MTSNSFMPEGENAPEDLSPEGLANAYLQRNRQDVVSRLAGVEATLAQLSADAPDDAKWLDTESQDSRLASEDQQLIAEMQELMVSRPKELQEHREILEQLLSNYDFFKEQVDQHDESTITYLSQCELAWREEQKSKIGNTDQSLGGEQTGE